MVYNYLRNRFDINANEVDVGCHEPKVFVAQFQHGTDHGRILVAQLRGYLMPLVWHPWQRTSLASAGFFCFHVLVALAKVPLHTRNATITQIVLGPACIEVELTRLKDMPDDDDWEFFMLAWCWHPSFIKAE